MLVHDTEPIGGAVEALRRLADANPLRLLTNNSTRTREDHAERLARVGFDVPADWILPTSYLAARWLRQHVGKISVWVLGEAGLRSELIEAGHSLAEQPEQADAVVVGMDRTVDYDRLASAYRALEAGARFIATNEDGTYPVPGGFLPGAGAMVGALRGMGFAPEVVIGKIAMPP